MNDEKKPSLKDLIAARSKREVPTSLGPLYVRHLVYKDYKKLVDTCAYNEANEREVGLLVIRATTSTSEHPDGWDGLDDEAFSKLSAADLEALAAVAIDEAAYAAADDVIASLGRGVLHQCAELSQASKKISDQFRNSFSFLQPSTLESLAASVTGIDQSSQKWKSLASTIFKDSAIGHVASPMDGLKSRHQAFPFDKERDSVLPKLDFSNTNDARAAKASERTVEILNQLATHMGEVQAHTASMYSTLVLEAIPQWMEQQKSNKEQSELSLRSAASSLRWTKWAVITSIVTSIGIAAYQQHTGSADAAATLRQANERQAHWERQSVAQQALLDEQIQATASLKTELKSLNTLLGESLASNASTDKRIPLSTTKTKSQK